jgi:protein phosphatase 2C family protein 2/3
MQGWRINMEDAHTHILSLAPEDPNAAFFAVYDGHGGAKVAQYAGNHLHRAILSQEEYSKGDIADALQSGFLQIDQDMLMDPDMKEELAGTTAISVLLKDNKIYCANVGDSRAVACFGGRADALSIDHKPSSDIESKRIVAAGGWVEFNRVNGNLALSRALGDFVFKRNEKKGPKDQIVTAFPDVQVREVTDDLEFIVLACDGIWDVMSNEEVIDFIRVRIQQKMLPSIICEELMTRCLAPGCQMGGLGCDNMTVILVCFVNGMTYEDYCVKCSTPFSAVSLSRDRGDRGILQRIAAEHHEDDENLEESGMTFADRVEGHFSETGSPLSSCSSSTPETPIDSPSDAAGVNIVMDEDDNEVSSGIHTDFMGIRRHPNEFAADPDEIPEVTYGTPEEFRSTMVTNTIEEPSSPLSSQSKSESPLKKEEAVV